MISFTQGSCVAFPTKRLAWSKGLILRRHVTTVHMVGKTERVSPLKYNFSLSIGAPCVRGVKVKPVKISAFKGTAQNDESGGRASESKIHKNSVKLSYIPKESEETVVESSKAHNVPLPYASETKETIAGSPAIQRLFKKWLTKLQTQSPCQEVDEVLGERPPPKEVSETNIEMQNSGRGETLKAVWGHFWDLDATVKIPLLIFVPWYLAVNVVYGAQVSKELIPLWVLGPIIIALYIKMLRWLFGLYVYCFKQTVKVVKNLPTYYGVASNYIFQGKLKEDFRACAWQPVVDFKNTDFEELTRRNLKVMQEWMMEKYLDYVESIWPLYCRTIRFLKRANLI
ncbi:uncharacterized protein LOC123211460 isoform X2 [Mangifera indica]|uniref:uncharacterized protein LOC123211460 isoform X2 n=1 Tax=Mangifera indica TaxID=29780 RepID=UPI001CFB1D84|nr:uncharacterized protein LOC123211460 isoform X2 [Mangifera indica]